MFGCFFMKKVIRISTAVIAVICSIIMAFVIIGCSTLPDTFVKYEESPQRLNSFYSLNTNTSSKQVDYQSASPKTETLSVFGIVPVKSVKVSVKHSPRVFVSGEVFGIKLYTDGVIIVGTQEVELDGGKKASPAAEAGLEKGDIIVSVNNILVFSSNEVMAILNENNGDSYKIRIKRDGRYKTFTLTPVYSSREGTYKAGMWVRDSTAGIGTLTFYNENYGTFAALGHQINDIDTNELMPLLEGEAVSATVTRVQKASAGVTGSLWCDFEDYKLGRLLDNSDSGLYGAFVKISDNAKEYPVASKQEVKKGKAQLVCTVSGKKPRAYDIEITRVTYNREGEQKDIVFRITDSELLKTTGGIVQGMSGSPVIQNGKLVGAVTHVIVNNPVKGYAIFAETMVEKSENLN